MTDVHSEDLSEEDFDTVLSPDIDFDGVINFEKSFLLRGNIKGEIDAHGVLLIDEGAVVHARIAADRIIVRGDVTGNITATNRLEITRTGKLAGDVVAPEINFETGCLFNGHCSMAPENNATVKE
jgi:cytoskeletal protein CcmA (bactofilin family)